MIMHSAQCAIIIDPSMQATHWLKAHLKDKAVETVNQQDPRLATQLELAVRFNKTLILQVRVRAFNIVL